MLQIKIQGKFQCILEMHQQKGWNSLDTIKAIYIHMIFQDIMWNNNIFQIKW